MVAIYNDKNELTITTTFVIVNPWFLMTTCEIGDNSGFLNHAKLSEQHLLLLNSFAVSQMVFLF